MTDIVLILTTLPDDDRGEALARVLVDERLAACVNLYAPMTSFYRWQGVVDRDIERQVVIKTTRDRVAAVQARIADLRAYALPEFVVLPVVDGSTAYLEWVRAQASEPSGA